jgi:hypothetical protein
MKTAVKHKCKHGCGYEHEKRGPMNIHELYHCKKKESSSRGSAAAPAKKQESSAGEMNCDCDDGGQWGFLSRTDPQHIAARARGFTKICTECGEIK